MIDPAPVFYALLMVALFVGLMLLRKRAIRKK